MTSTSYTLSNFNPSLNKSKLFSLHTYILCIYKGTEIFNIKTWHTEENIAWVYVSALNFNLKNFRFYRNSRETGINVNDLTLWIAYCNSISKTFSFSIPLHLRVYRVQINITFILKIKYSKHINEHITYFCNLFIITLNTEYMPVNNRNNNNINNKNNNKPHVCVCASDIVRNMQRSNNNKNT